MTETKVPIQVTITIDGVTTHKKVKLDTFIIGRHADSDVNVLHPQVSRQHLRVSVIDHVIYFEDIGSSNGTFKDKKRLPMKQAFVIESNDILQLGEDGPTIQIHFEEKKTNTALSKLESLISPVTKSVAKAVQVVPPAPIKEISEVKQNTKSVTIPEPLSAPSPAIPTPPAFTEKKSTEPEKPPTEAELTILEANKQAAIILQKAQVDAEAKAQAAYKHAIETEQRAEKLFQDKLKEANNEAEKIYEVTRKDNQNLLQEARSQAQMLREQAEKDARELRKSTEKKCTEFLAQAEEQAQELKAKRLSEADEIIEKKGQDLLKATYEKIEKEKLAGQKELDSLKGQLAEIQKNKKEMDSEFENLKKGLSDIKTQIMERQNELDSKKSDIEKISSQKEDLHTKFEKIKKELETEEQASKELKEEKEKILLDITALNKEKELREKEISSELQLLKKQIEDDKANLAKKEEERINQLKLETSEAIKKFEKELIDQVVERKNQITKEILLQIEATCTSVALNEEWKKNQSNLNQIIQDIIGDTDQSSVQKTLDGKKKYSPRKRERTISLGLGLAVGVLIAVSSGKIVDNLSGSPVERMVASAIDAAKKDLQNRKFDPKQTDKVRDNYVDTVIYTKNFSQLYMDSKFQEKWTKEATLYLLKTWRLDEDKSAKVLSISAALVKDLAERKENIHPDFVKLGISKMREIEKRAISRIKNELGGGNVRLESFKNFEKKFFEKYDRMPASE